MTPKSRRSICSVIFAGAEDFDGLYERSIQTDIEGVPVRIASLADLLAMKRAADRPKDREHIMQLEALQRLIGTDTG